MRADWQIENRLHWPRDVTLAALRNAVLGLLHGHAAATCAASIRTCAWSSPDHLFVLLGLPGP